MKKLTAKQKQILEALKLPNAKMFPPSNMDGKRLGWVSTQSSTQGLVCSVPLKAFNILKELKLIFESAGLFYLKK